MSKSTTHQVLSKGSVHSHYKKYIAKNTFLTYLIWHLVMQIVLVVLGYKVKVQA